MSIDLTYQQNRVQIRDDGNLHIPSGQTIDIETGGLLTNNGLSISMYRNSYTFTQAVLNAAWVTAGSSGTSVQQTIFSLPVGAFVIRYVISAITGFTGDPSSATLRIGDGTTADRFSKSLGDSIYTTIAGIGFVNVPSGSPGNASATTPLPLKVTFTSASSWGNVSAGVCTLDVYWGQN